MTSPINVIPSRSTIQALLSSIFGCLGIENTMALVITAFLPMVEGPVTARSCRFFANRNSAIKCNSKFRSNNQC